MEVKSLQNPPDGVKIVMKAACIMFGEKPKMKDDPDNMGEHTATALAGCTRACRSLTLAGRTSYCFSLSTLLSLRQVVWTQFNWGLNSDCATCCVL